MDATASSSELRSAYLRMLKLWHPDRFPSDSASYPDAIRQTQLINHAYQTLVGDATRQEVKQVLSEARPAVGWNGRLIRTTLGPLERTLTVACVAFGLFLAYHFLTYYG